MINSFVTRSRETEDPRNVWQAARVSKVVSHDGGAHAGPASHAVRESASAFDTRHKALTRCCQRGGAQHRGAGEHVGLCCTACQLIEHDAHYSGPMQGRRREIMALLMRELPDTAAATLLLDRLEPGDDEVLLCPSAGFSASQCPPRLCQSREQMGRIDGNGPGWRDPRRLSVGRWAPACEGRAVVVFAASCAVTMLRVSCVGRTRCYSIATATCGRRLKRV